MSESERWTINTCPGCGRLLDRRRGVGGWWCLDHGEAIPPIAVDVVPAERMRHAENVAESWQRLADANGAEAMRRAEQLRRAVALTDADRRFIARILLRNTAGPDRRYAETIVAKFSARDEDMHEPAEYVPPIRTIMVCGTCGILLPQKLWGGARVVAGAICAHRDPKARTLGKADADPLQAMVCRAVRHWIVLDSAGKNPRVVTSERDVRAYAKTPNWQVFGPFVPEANSGAVSLAALREIAREMYEGLEVGSPEQLAVSEFLGRAESLGGSSR